MVGLATTVEPLVELSPLAGDQLYVLAPLAVRVTEPVEQIVGAFGLMVMIGLGLMMMLVVAVPVQPVVAVPTTE
jgi:hypothetical protein